MNFLKEKNALPKCYIMSVQGTIKTIYNRFMTDCKIFKSAVYFYLSEKEKKVTYITKSSLSNY